MQQPNEQPAPGGFLSREEIHYPFESPGDPAIYQDEFLITTPQGQVLAGKRYQQGLKLSCGCLMRHGMDVGLCVKTRTLRCTEKHLRTCMLCGEQCGTHILQPYAERLPDGCIMRGYACHPCIRDRHRGILAKLFNFILRRNGRHVE